jgi:hypothetical protein
MRTMYGLGLIAVLVGGASAAPPPSRRPARLIDVHLHVWDPVPADTSFRSKLRAAFAAFHLEQAVVSGPAELVPAAVLCPLSHVIPGRRGRIGGVDTPVGYTRREDI